MNSRADPSPTPIPIRMNGREAYVAVGGSALYKLRAFQTILSHVPIQ